MEIAIVKYNAGNIQSVLYALERLGTSAVVTDDHEELKRADKVIFPGVGEASSAMKYLRERNLDKLITSLSQPVLGICLGMQLMCSWSEENDTTCFGIFDVPVKLFKPDAGLVGEITDTKNKIDKLKTPQIGWNNIYNLRSKLFTDVSENSFCYFVHGYYAALGEHTIATTDYVQPYSSALHRDNFYGVQFHTEKSAATGAKILENFLKLS